MLEVGLLSFFVGDERCNATEILHVPLSLTAPMWRAGAGETSATARPRQIRTSGANGLRRARGLIQLVLLAVWWEPRHAASGMTMSHEDPVQHSDGRSTKALHVEDTEYWSTRCGMRGEYSNHGARQARPEKGPDTR